MCTMAALPTIPCATAGLPDWLNAPQLMRRFAAAVRAAAGPNNRPLILTFVSYDYNNIVENWLLWIQSTSVDLSHVMVVTQGDSQQQLGPLLAKYGVATFTLPLLNPSGTPKYDELGRKVGVWRNGRSG